MLLSYRLSGRVTDASGNPIRGATVVTRTNDRDFWTFSEPSDANGRYNGFFPASDKSGNDPVEFAVQIAYGRTSYTTGVRNPTFKRLSSVDDGRPTSGFRDRRAAARRRRPCPARSTAGCSSACRGRMAS